MDLETQVIVTMKTILAAVAALIVGGGAVLWTVLSFTVGGMRDDVKSIRDATQTLQVADKDSAIRIRETENRLIEKMGGLNLSIADLSGKLGATSTTMASLSGRIDEIQKSVAKRQRAVWDWDTDDSKAAAAIFVANLKKAGLSDDKVVVVPFTATGVDQTK